MLRMDKSIPDEEKQKRIDKLLKDVKYIFILIVTNLL